MRKTACFDVHWNTCKNNINAKGGYKQCDQIWPNFAIFAKSAVFGNILRVFLAFG